MWVDCAGGVNAGYLKMANFVETSNSIFSTTDFHEDGTPEGTHLYNPSKHTTPFWRWNNVVRLLENSYNLY